ncbi:hypothetical protein BpHYR1_008653 [Brachionus plicatilis]|uniref:Uncharacterized protein n=1 Tax=Brachionus plicatilis TaxID=10195 RepID=A0A3M7TAG4_BRAPC|nr:hypothetical protein BpHYR1_008653 [Brachionus plicatilis]
MVRIGSFEQVSLHILLQGLGQLLAVLDVHAEQRERLLARISVRTALANFLVGKHAAKYFRAYLLPIQHFHGLVNAVDDAVEELYGVVLLSQIDPFAQTESKLAPKALGHIELHFALGQMSKDHLHILQYAQIVFFALFVLTFVQITGRQVRIGVVQVVELGLAQTSGQVNLLQHRVHVAGGAGVLEAHKSIVGPLAQQRQVLPFGGAHSAVVCELSAEVERAVASIQQRWIEHLEQKVDQVSQIVQTAGAQRYQQIECAVQRH